MPKKFPKAARPSNALPVESKLPPEMIWAELKTEGVLLNAVTIRSFNHDDKGGGDIKHLLDRLRADVDASKRGESDMADRLLISQAVALDGVFNAMMQRAALNLGEYPDAVERYMRLGLKAQSQCRATLESLSRIKNPPNVAFVKQANIAHGPQQVNNGTAHGNTETTQVEVLEGIGHERMDARTPGTAGRSDTPLEAVAAVHRPAHG